MGMCQENLHVNVFLPTYPLAENMTITLGHISSTDFSPTSFLCPLSSQPRLNLFSIPKQGLALLPPCSGGMHAFACGMVL